MKPIVQNFKFLFYRYQENTSLTKVINGLNGSSFWIKYTPPRDWNTETTVQYYLKYPLDVYVKCFCKIGSYEQTNDEPFCSKKMTFEIVETSQIVVPSSAIQNSQEFTSDKKRIYDFNNLWYYFICKKNGDDVGIYLRFQRPRNIGTICQCTCTVNSITKTLSSEKNMMFSQFGKEVELFSSGYMRVDFTVKFNFFSLFRSVTDMSEMSHSLSLWKHQESKDFTICVGDQKIKVHKCILSVASPVFDAMLKPHCKEFKEGKVAIEDFDYSTVQAALFLMYTRKLGYFCNTTITVLLNLSKFADKYMLVDLDQILVPLYCGVNLGNLDEVLVFAKTNSRDELYKKCVDFFAMDFEENCRKYKDLDSLDSDFLKAVVKKKYGRHTLRADNGVA
uniref:BTB domain-containing protein n=1 Tax=Panagrolaimus sp. JU765 TaxID=591449 RepID=A0AC34R1X5_9BILA